MKFPLVCGFPPPPRSTLFPYTTLFRSGCTDCARYRPATDRPRARRIRIHLRESPGWRARRSEEHTSELQSHVKLVCRLLLEKKNRHRCVRTGLTLANQAELKDKL